MLQTHEAVYGLIHTTQDEYKPTLWCIFEWLQIQLWYILLQEHSEYCKHGSKNILRFSTETTLNRIFQCYMIDNFKVTISLTKFTSIIALMEFTILWALSGACSLIVGNSFLSINLLNLSASLRSLTFTCKWEMLDLDLIVMKKEQWWRWLQACFILSVDVDLVAVAG